MAYTLKEIVPWGRTFEEYEAMFALGRPELAGPVLGCGDGPASFNAVLTGRGGSVVSADPIYEFSAGAIEARIHEVFETVLGQARANRDEFVWTRIRSVEELGRIRMEAMRAFLADYENGLREGRYVRATLPALPFPGGRFRLALVSHLLFLYSEHLDLAFHLDSLRELCRVSEEVRVFPLLELGGAKSRHLDGVISGLSGEGYAVEVREVDYEFQRGGREMLVVSAG